jgi:hypothetical protein
MFVVLDTVFIVVISSLKLFFVQLGLNEANTFKSSSIIMTRQGTLTLTEGEGSAWLTSSLI